MASAKLLHWGVEYLEFRLVRESLVETLLRAMPHIPKPRRFVLLIRGGMCFERETPTARTPEDLVWRRSKLGLLLKPERIGAIDRFMVGARHEPSRAAE